MGMSWRNPSAVGVCAHEPALRSKFGGGGLVPVHFSGNYSSCGSSGSDVVSASSRRWEARSSNGLLTCFDAGCRSRNGSEIVHGSGRSLGLRLSGRVVRLENSKHKHLSVRAAGDQNGKNTTGDDPVETLFMKELRRRGISSDGKGSTGTETRTKSDDDNVGGPGSSERGWSQQGGSKTKSSSQWTAAETDDQLKRSRALNSEGLEGLIPRATELLKLGGSFWIVFWPLILASLATFITLYVYFGANFLHTGSSIYPGGRPPYVEPYQLLEEETIPLEIGPDRVPYSRSNASP
ncbi:hypothetical protein MPTK1_3g20740 [Marchantia polymorpha subsp. ruderalis]|uniref:Uncharacterized protein n=2 Tax=Marchantia polymorpha TaxID=3197 RepID=A0A176VZU3_MARPO|nr:hypothetical protein AXG93_583s1040 [Marchantia polymorpha subsp. ruderalis]PTQ28586.1 hypothetical protein MARPO_0159s0003 [Marchantia polymorpha]BBN06392.1 hypothetical protein Mp_3g20740 [Marchantia polymorpha subsp. ruderalis]|eukprot:PTQ28586.1 hypothetical protein MARPO_0159s0003 [Marchantia polymorpha]